jgi:hypothetical protein
LLISEFRVRKILKENSWLILNYYPVIPPYAGRTNENDENPQS